MYLAGGLALHYTVYTLYWETKPSDDGDAMSLVTTETPAPALSALTIPFLVTHPVTFHYWN